MKSLMLLKRPFERRSTGSAEAGQLLQMESINSMETAFIIVKYFV
jgi:hypothetical protein